MSIRSESSHTSHSASVIGRPPGTASAPRLGLIAPVGLTIANVLSVGGRVLSEERTDGWYFKVFDATARFTAAR
ncbi:hypothetical protein J8F10_10875 [Gemmata sp. G18]|uniref:Uncharacterized protein n=1 Tax=Gemmata palustris TaxID=2822762 RepID=A0ABS5BQ04_9BACT|nr:hypothetical protein [Gemmata palustris]MBP3955786.1 hypothetical protein [Gemmata palustris]